MGCCLEGNSNRARRGTTWVVGIIVRGTMIPMRDCSYKGGTSQVRGLKASEAAGSQAAICSSCLRVVEDGSKMSKGFGFWVGCWWAFCLGVGSGCPHNFARHELSLLLNLDSQLSPSKSVGSSQGSTPSEIPGRRKEADSNKKSSLQISCPTCRGIRTLNAPTASPPG